MLIYNFNLLGLYKYLFINYYALLSKTIEELERKENILNLKMKVKNVGVI